MERKQQSSQRREEEDFTPIPDPPAGAAAPSQTADLDSLLDEIDGVLETNAEEFVKGFVQKGGQ